VSKRPKSLIKDRSLVKSLIKDQFRPLLNFFIFRF
jgi:hypothetical protein